MDSQQSWRPVHGYRDFLPRVAGDVGNQHLSSNGPVGSDTDQPVQFGLLCHFCRRIQVWISYNWTNLFDFSFDNEDRGETVPFRSLA